MWLVNAKKPLLAVVALVVILPMLAAACTSGVPREKLDAVTAQLTAKEQEVTLLRTQMGAQATAKEQEAAQLRKQLAAMGPSTVVQAGQLQAAPAAGPRSAWDTDESIKGQLQLLATYDSSGPAAWDPVAHPLVYMTSEGRGYDHRPSKTTKLPGVQVIDATTKTVVTSAQFDLGTETTMEPHGLGASPDGKWIYIASADRTATREIRNLVLIINARTLKLDKLLTHPVKRLHHIGGFKDWMGRDRVVLDMGFGADGGPHFVLDPSDNNRVVKAITYDQVRPMGHPYTAPDPTGKFLYISMGAPEIREAHSQTAGIAKFDLEKGIAIVIEGVGNHPIGIAHTANGRYTYVNDGTNSLVFKIDNKTNKIVGRTSAGVAGPYGLRLNWDETELYTMGKGEGSHNTGGVVGVIDTKLFQPTRAFNQPINIGGSIIDHGILHPDPKVNELWVSSSGTWETIVLDLTKREVKARIPSPHGGGTHSGAFARYNPDFSGELLIDMLGPQKAMFATMKERAEKVGASQ